MQKLQEIQDLMNQHNSFINKAFSSININDNDSIDNCTLFLRFSIGKLNEAIQKLEELKLATYEYQCTNEECEDFSIKKEVKIPMSEYSEEKLPLCEKCSGKTSRTYSAVGHQTFGDGYKG